MTSLEHCPDFNERHTLLNGVTRAIAYPNPGYNCNADYGLWKKVNWIKTLVLIDKNNTLYLIFKK